MRIILFTALLLIYTNSFAAIYKWVDENGKTHFGDKPVATSQALTTRSQAINNTSKLTSTNWYQLLIQKQFHTLTFKIEKLQRLVNNDIKQDIALVRAYNTFNNEEPILSQRIAQWVALSPRNYAPYLARAYNYYKKGWQARGYQFRSNTSDEAIKKMNDYFQLAISDLNTVAKFAPNSLPAYQLRLRIYATLSKDKAFEKTKKAALKRYPASLKIRQAVIDNLRPQWGGSLKQMATFIKATEKYYKDNPNLLKLRAEIPVNVGGQLFSKKEYSLAIRYLKKATQLNPNRHYSFYKLALSYYFADLYKQAYKAASKAIKLSPRQSDYYQIRAKIALYLNNIKQAEQDKEKANQYDPTQAENFNKQYKKVAKNALLINRVIAYKKNINTLADKKLSNLTQAIKRNPNNAYLYYQRASLHYQKQELAKALGNIKKAINIQPHKLVYYQLIDKIFLAKKQYKNIITYWNQFITNRPKHHLGHLNLYKAYYLNKELNKAKEHLLLAAQYGNKKAKAILKTHYSK